MEVCCIAHRGNDFMVKILNIELGISQNPPKFVK